MEYNECLLFVWNFILFVWNNAWLGGNLHIHVLSLAALYEGFHLAIPYCGGE